MYDLIIKDAKQIDGTKTDIAISNGIIVKIAETIEADSKKILTLPESSFLSAGWIDSHVHCYEKMTLYTDFPDEVGVKTGVTTIVDAGSTGASNVGDFYHLAQKAKTNVFALLNVAATGIVQQNELVDLTQVRGDLVSQALQQYPDFIKGLKVRMSHSVVGGNGIAPLILAKKMQHENHSLPLMVHIGSAPPKLSHILTHLEANDIVTHCFNGKENGFLNQQNQIKAFVRKAYRKGIIFDVGHGSDSFNFHVADVAFKENIKATTISTDMYCRNRKNGPVYNLATTLEKLYEVGYPLSELIEKVTVAPAKALRLKNKGMIQTGYDADFTIFKVANVSKKLIDSNGHTRETTVCILPQTAIIGGNIYDIEQK